MLGIGSCAGPGVLKKAEEEVLGELGAECLIASEDSERNSDVRLLCIAQRMESAWKDSERGRPVSATRARSGRFSAAYAQMNAETRGLAL